MTKPFLFLVGKQRHIISVSNKVRQSDKTYELSFLNNSAAHDKTGPERVSVTNYSVQEVTQDTCVRIRECLQNIRDGPSI